MAKFLCSLILFSCIAAPGFCATISCYSCDGIVEQGGTRGSPCGWYTGWTAASLDKGTGVQCPEGLCHTIVTGTANAAPVVTRGCGFVPCNRLPPTFQADPKVCDITTNRLATNTTTLPAGQLVEERRWFFNSLPEKGYLATQVEYCNADWCSRNGEALVTSYNQQAVADHNKHTLATAPVVPPFVVPAPIIVPAPVNPAPAPIVAPLIVQLPAPLVAIKETVVPPVVSSNVAVQGGAFTCYSCQGVPGQACGLNAHFTTSYLEGSSTKECPDGLCYTYVKNDVHQDSVVYRGCGLLTCDLLPPGNNNSDVCENRNGVWGVKAAPGGPRSFSTPAAVKEFASGALMYCTEDRCNKGGIQQIDGIGWQPFGFVVAGSASNTASEATNKRVAPLVAPVPVPAPATDPGSGILLANSPQPAGNETATNTGIFPGGAIIGQSLALASCISCRTAVTEACGRLGNKDAIGIVKSVRCDVGYCYTFVKAEAGAQVMVSRGCGGVRCDMIPGFQGRSDFCDERGTVVKIDPKSGTPFNQSRNFNIGFAPGRALQAGTLQYCDSGSDCNAGSVAMMPLKDYYYLVESGSDNINKAFGVWLIVLALVLTVIR